MENYETLIFDMDGVMTSEECYWDTAALTVEELFSGSADEAQVKSVRDRVFYGDRLIRLFKDRGVNSNWDLAYLVFAFLHTCKSGEGIYNEFCNTRMKAFELYEAAAKALSQSLGKPYGQVCRLGEVWNNLKDVFQEWFWGSEEYFNVHGQKARRDDRGGLYKNEKPLIPLDELKSLLETLDGAGFRLCVGTGRPAAEIYAPLLLWGLYDFFDQNAIINYDDVERAEKKTGKKGLTKPHPYMFFKAYFGRDYPDELILDGKPKPIKNCLVIGDAGADLMAAHSMGADFAAVLTGISGAKSREFFEKNNAKYILKAVMSLAAEA